MSIRVMVALRWEIVNQFRNGFYLVSILFALIWITLLRLIPERGRVDATLLVPAFMVLNLMITTYYYVGALVLLEKGDGVLDGLVVSPLRDVEYLLAKIISLTGLAAGESLLIVALVFGLRFSWLPMLAGLLVLGAFYTLAGFVAIVRYDSINRYLLPSMLIVTILMLPVVDHLDLWQTPLTYLHPIQPALSLMRAAFTPAAGWEIVYGGLAGSVWILVLLVWARRAFGRFIVRAA